MHTFVASHPQKVDKRRHLQILHTSYGKCFIKKIWTHKGWVTLPKVNDFYLLLEVAIHDDLKTMCFIHFIGVSPMFRIFHWLLLLKPSTKRCSVKLTTFLQNLWKISAKLVFSKVARLQLVSKKQHFTFYIVNFTVNFWNSIPINLIQTLVLIKE